ncbi:MAG TPA: acyltransferase [Candidatus Saccharimonadales bacterium]|nr:acyltransferase [Candidatus Saccharimonadales bacterium]
MKSEEHYKNLDGLRGVAALAVVFYHYATTFFPFLIGYSITTRHSHFDRLFSNTPFGLPFAGNFAVCIFFVLSGFVLSVGFFKHGRQIATLVSSATRRYFRLMLPALGAILLAYVLMRLGLFYNHQAAAISQTSVTVSQLWHFPAHLTSALFQGLYTIWFGNYSNIASYNNVLWTMHYELFGSFLVFMVLALFGSTKNRWLFYGILALAFVKSYYLAFIAGVAISDLTYNLPAYKNYLKAWILWPALAVGIFLGTWTANIYPHLRTGYTHAWPFFEWIEAQQFAHIVGAIMLVVVVLNSGALTRVLETRACQWLGKVSFGLYLTHYLVIGTLASYIFTRLYGADGFKAALVGSIVVTLPLTFVVAHFYTRLVDIPAIALSKRIGNYLLEGNLLSDVRRAVVGAGNWQPAPHTQARQAGKPVSGPVPQPEVE